MKTLLPRLSLSVSLAVGFGLPAQATDAMTAAMAARASHAPSECNITVGDMSYDASTIGLSKYMESIRDKEPTLYQSLLPSLEDLQGRQHKASLYGWSIGGVGMAATLGGLAWGIGISSDPSRSIKGPLWLTSGGFALFLIGIAVSFAYRPDRQDLLDFVNKHNSQSPKAPMKFNLGMVPQEHGASLAFSARF